MMKLLYTKRSPYARKARIIAIEKGIDLELIDEDLINKSDRLIEANPLGKVPALILDDGTTIADSTVICDYLESLQPDPRMVPESSGAKFRVLTLASLADGMADNTVALYMEKMRHKEAAHPKFVEAQIASIQRALAFFEKHVSELEDLSLASVAVASAIGYLNFRVPDLWPSGNAKLAQWYDTVCERPSFSSTVPIN